jgi:hypothetical protein
MRAVDRAKRDANVLRLFLAGLSHRDIAAVVGLRSPQSVGNIVRRELGRDEERRQVLDSHGGAMFVERAESLLQQYWPAALAGDYKATTTCLRVLDAQARFHGLYA